MSGKVIADGLTSSFPNGIDGFFIDDQAVKKTADYSVVANTDSGKTFYIRSSIVFTLPAIDDGNVYEFVNLAEDGTAALRLAPNAADAIVWKGDAVGNKYVENTLATAKKGDMIRISYFAANTWQVLKVRGIWAKEA